MENVLCLKNHTLLNSLALAEGQRVKQRRKPAGRMEEKAAGRKRASPSVGTNESHPLYSIWKDMRARCCIPTNHAYKYYGGRGIKVCARWKVFRHFIADIPPRPTPRHTLDRVNNNGNYEPSNCRWATRKEQSSNMRSNHYVEFNGERRTISQWAEHLRMGRSAILKRIQKGWDLSDALTLASQKGKRGFY